MCTRLLLAVAAIVITDTHAARILGLFPHTGKSHQMVFEPLLRTLAERGHHVTTVSFFPLKNPPANYTDVSLEGIAGLGLETFDLSIYESPNLLLRIPIVNRIAKQLMEFHPLAGMALNVCGKALDWPPLIEALKGDYDVVLVENFNSDCMLGLLHVYGIKSPVVALLSCNILPWSGNRIGVLDNPAFVPVISTSFTSRMTFAEKLENTFLQLYHNFWFYYAIQVKERELIEKRFGRKIPDLYDLGKNYSLMMVNTFHALNGVRPTVPGVIEVGGMHLDHKRKVIPPYIEKFLNESEHGVILLSFGSLIKTSTIPKYKEDMIVNALAKLKQRVIWKFEGSGEEGTLTGNILRVKWLPQYELLQNKKVVAFIAHGGLLGMTEAISAGKPMVVVPFFGDQPANAAAAAAAGFATVVPYIELTEEKLTKALEFVLSAETRLNARRVSSIWRDRQADPLETAVYWTERVIRWGHHAQLHSPARDMPLYQIALLDVIATLVIAILIILAISWYILSKVFRLLFGRESKLKMH
ncbi:UDP-glucosyltransferase 2-like isoform X3 [Papilio machaon]|uniref:UDP-glucosyltransferase 2-like isoform X3 n=1 Tax=Papilio machaon TaxID=76193 RepID=UPI001E665C90|nr:UDP-glucosyltransferase 2-like isoform X3 [Papilio machaon]